jgi:hypothetical protein
MNFGNVYEFSENFNRINKIEKLEKAAQYWVRIQPMASSLMG